MHCAYSKAKGLYSILDSERGVYFVLLAVVLLTIISIIGMVIDHGRLSLEALIVQRAADAGALVGAARIGAISPSQIPTLAEAVARDNLDRNLISYDSSNLTAHFQATANTGSSSVELEVSVDSESFIRGKVLPGNKDWDVVRSAKAEKRPLAVVIVADVSRSSVCPAVWEGDADDCGPFPGSRLEAMLTAGRNFIDELDEQRDAVGIVLFAESINHVLSLQNPFDADDVKNNFTNVDWEYGKNLEAAIAEARQQFADFKTAKGQTVYDSYVKVIGLVTDGSVTHATSTEADLINNFPNCNAVSGYYRFIYAIKEADSARDEGIYVYSVGAGMEDPEHSTCWQSGNEQDYHHYVKSCFLKRLANDADAAVGEPVFPSPCIPTYTDLLTKPRGEYQTSLDANDLVAMLSRFWRRVQLRLMP